jgi:hypothetical protein
MMKTPINKPPCAGCSKNATCTIKCEKFRKHVKELEGVLVDREHLRRPPAPAEAAL